MQTSGWPWRLTLAVGLGLAAGPAAAQGACGEPAIIATHDRSTTAYSIGWPLAAAPQKGRVTLVLLAGGPGHLALDAIGCPRKLKGNALVRSRHLFQRAGFITVLVDAPSDHHGQDGLGGFRTSARHAEDIGKIIAAVRARTKAPVWLVGTSRGAISAVNAASRLTGPAAPDGLVITSPVTSGRSGGRKPWVAQTVFSTRLEAIRVPMLVVVHADDSCIRSPPRLARRMLDRIPAKRAQLVTVTGGPVGRRDAGLAACKGRSAHGFLGQEAQLVDGIDRFVRGGRY